MSTSYLTDHRTALREADDEEGVPQGLDVWKRTIPTGRYRIDADWSTAEFVARTLRVVPVQGEFSDVSGELELTEPLERTSVRIEVAADSLDTGNRVRDAHLRSGQFLAAADEPTLGFTSDHVQPLGGDTFAVHGQLTIRGTSHPAVFHVTLTDTHRDNGRRAVTFVGTAQVDRRAFDVPSSELAAMWGLIVAPEVLVRLTLVARQV